MVETTSGAHKEENKGSIVKLTESKTLTTVEDQQCLQGQ